VDLYIATLAEIKAVLGIEDAVDNANLTLWLEGLQGRFDGFLERTLLEGADVQEIFDGDVTSLYPSRCPIERVSEIVIADDQDWADGDVLDADDYVIIHARGRILYGGVYKWPAGRQNIRVTYTGGLFSSANDGTAANSYVRPADVAAARRAMVMQARYEWQHRDLLGLQSLSAQGTNVNLAQAELLPEVRQTLNPLRRLL
jgi:hypothetical protein